MTMAMTTEYDHAVWSPDTPWMRIDRETGDALARLHQYLISTILASETEAEAEIPTDDEIARMLDAEGIALHAPSELFYGDRGAFVKMHRSPKDADWLETGALPCVRGNVDLAVTLVKSARVCEDWLDGTGGDRLYFLPFRHDVRPENEFRAFVDGGCLSAVRQTPLADGQPSDFTEEEIRATAARACHHDLGARWPRCAIDFEVLAPGRAWIFEVNPYDASTDEYL